MFRQVILIRVFWNIWFVLRLRDLGSSGWSQLLFWGVGAIPPCPFRNQYLGRLASPFLVCQFWFKTQNGRVWIPTLPPWLLPRRGSAGGVGEAYYALRPSAEAPPLVDQLHLWGHLCHLGLLVINGEGCFGPLRPIGTLEGYICQRYSRILYHSCNHTIFTTHSSEFCDWVLVTNRRRTYLLDVYRWARNTIIVTIIT